MALRGTLTHRKTRRLAKLLDIPACFALGLMESLWHVTAEQQPDGGIGRMSNQDIADEMFYDGDADKLIRAMIDSGWIDEYEECRLVVHDWHDHADQSVKRKVARHGSGFVGHIPQMTSHDYPCLDVPSSPEPEPVPEPVVNTELQTGGNRESERELQNWREIVGALSALLPDATRRDPITQTALEEWARYAPERHAKRWPRATIEATAAMLSGLAPPGIRDSIKEAIQANSCHLRPPRSTPRQATNRRSATATYERLSQ